MLPLINEILLRDSAKFSSLPEERSSRTTTLSPRRTSSSTVFEPIKPAPPVTKKRMRKILLDPHRRATAFGCDNGRRFWKDERPPFWYAQSWAGLPRPEPRARHERVLYDGIRMRQGSIRWKVA